MSVMQLTLFTPILFLFTSHCCKIERDAAFPGSGYFLNSKTKPWVEAQSPTKYLISRRFIFF